MDGIRPRALGGGDDLVTIEIGPRFSRADGDRLTGLADIGAGGIGIGMNRYRGDVHRIGGADDATGDFAAVGDEKLVHGPLLHAPCGLQHAPMSKNHPAQPLGSAVQVRLVSFHTPSTFASPNESTPQCRRLPL